MRHGNVNHAHCGDREDDERETYECVFVDQGQAGVAATFESVPADRLYELRDGALSVKREMR